MPHDAADPGSHLRRLLASHYTCGARGLQRSPPALARATSVQTHPDDCGNRCTSTTDLPSAVTAIMSSLSPAFGDTAGGHHDHRYAAVGQEPVDRRAEQPLLEVTLPMRPDDDELGIFLLRDRQDRF
jgi:hypothetical protein